MILDFSAYEYYIRPGVTDSRKSWRSLAEMADTRMGISIREKAMFLFCNRSRNCIKILAWDNGYWVLMKRIPKGTFAWPDTEEEAMNVTSSTSQEKTLNVWSIHESASRMVS